LRDGETAVGGGNVATAFDTALLSLSPAHFGTAENRNYIWHSILGMNENDPVTTPWSPDAGIVTSECGTGSQADGFGTGYQTLSRLTGGLRYPICSQGNPPTTNFDPIFHAIAQGVIDTAAIPCEYDFPDVDGIINPANIKVRYTPNGGGSEVEFSRVTNEAACTSGDDVYI